MNTNINSSLAPLPFLRWAGGKGWLVDKLKSTLHINQYVSYHEPFIGGGAILFNFTPPNAHISDFNNNLIQCYINVRDHVDLIIEHIKNFECTEKEYYKIRSQKSEDSIYKAAQFIYLNQMSFNGIYRENSKGEYNVPYGRRGSFRFNFENLKRVSNYLETVKISTADFAKCLDDIQEGSLIFLDPPYTVSHNNNGFIQYNQKIFALEDQYRLAEVITEIKNKGAFYILTNANHKKIKEIFDLGDHCFEVERMSVIGGLHAQRGKYKECIFTNINLKL